MKRIALALLFSGLLQAQSVEVFSEFWPLNRERGDAEPREIISPAVARNAFATFKVVVKAPAASNYFLFCQANPDHIVETHLYKLSTPGDSLEPVRSPNFGVIPSDGSPRAYLLDIWIPPDAEAGRRVRVELQLKVGDWTVYPMELRIQKAVTPLLAKPLAIPSDLDAALLRNREQDASLESLLGLPEVLLLTARHIVNAWTAYSPFDQSRDYEWYLKARELMYRRSE